MESWTPDEDGEKMRLARSVKELTELIRFNRRDMQVGVMIFTHKRGALRFGIVAALSYPVFSSTVRVPI